jgi:predicted AlkP superfamily phosphohydrolase/phosphomutase
MDPGFLERHWGELPNLDSLRRKGEFKRLRTVMPPQSPVAWSTFITGLNPGGHGVWDFIHRRPDTLTPFSSMSETEAPKWQLPIGPYLLPLGRGKVEVFRSGQPFWKILAEKGVRVTVLRMPTNFPPLPVHDEELSGMGTPDLRGTFGTFTFYTDKPGENEHETAAGRIVPVALKDHQASLRLLGPANSLRRDHADTFIDIAVSVDPRARAARFEAQGRQFVLAEGEWSSWIHAKFTLIPGLKSVAGMFRVYAKELGPRFQVYISPVNIDPAEPEMPITTPPEYGRQLVEAVGPFYTQGMPEETAALREGYFNLTEYKAQSRLVSEEHLRILRYAVERFQDGVLFFHFFGIDQDSHMMWGRHEGELLDTYRTVDRTIGWVMAHARDAQLIVMSDHGFSTFDRAVHVNTWLAEHGFLMLKDGNSTADGEGFANVDWSRTQAYAVGLNAIYLNFAGREKNGIVTRLDDDALLADIGKGLKELRDPENGEAVVEDVYVPREIYPNGTNMQFAPDLLIGYRPGYRASWQTALGGTPRGVIVANHDPWMGDHCIDTRFVPGVLLSSRRSGIPDPALADLTVSILGEFGIKAPETMAGRNIYNPVTQVSVLGGDNVRVH